MYEQAVTGDVEAIEALLQSVSRRLNSFSFALSQAVRVRASKEDVVQVTLIRVYEALISGALENVPEDEFNLWVKRSAHNVVRNFTKVALARKRSVARQQTIELADESSMDVETNDLPVDVQVDNEEIVADLLGRVKRDDDRAILLGIMEGKSYGQIAEGLGLPVDRIYWRVKYLRTLASRVAL